MNVFYTPHYRELYLKKKRYAPSSEKAVRKALTLLFEYGSQNLASFQEDARKDGKTPKTITCYSSYVKGFFKFIETLTPQPQKVEQNEKPKSELDILNEELLKNAEEEPIKKAPKRVCGDCRFFRNVNFCPKVVTYSPQQKSGEFRLIDLLCMPHEKACQVFQSKKKRANSTDPDMGEILTLLNDEFVFKCPTDTEEILGYEEGQYKPFKCVIKHKLEKLYGDDLKRAFVDETLAHIQRANYVERKEINKFINKIPLQNGLFNILNREVEPFGSEQVFTYKLNIKYDPSAECPTWLKFINEIVRPEDIPLLQEIMGYCILPAMPFHKIFWFYGVGRNGKDRVILTLEHMLGEDSCSHLNLGELRETRRFSVAQLYGKLLNVSSEPDIKYAIQTNILKLISGENTIHAELKGKNKRIVFTNKAKVIVVGNNFPKVEDSSIGFWERIEVLNFPFSFIGKDMITNIEKTWLDNPDEVSGIFNWMLEGLYRLKENGEFSTSLTTEETKAEFMRISDPFRAWLNDCCVFIPVGKVTREEAYNSYKNYSDELGTSPDNIRNFYGKMRKTPKIKDYRTRIDGKTERGFQGITIKTEEERENGMLQKKLVSGVSIGSRVTSRECREDILNIVDKNREYITPDTSDTLDTKNKKPFDVDKAFTQLQCFDCRKILDENTPHTFYQGNPFCFTCYHKLKDQEKKIKKTLHKEEMKNDSLENCPKCGFEG